MLVDLETDGTLSLGVDGEPQCVSLNHDDAGI